MKSLRVVCLLTILALILVGCGKRQEEARIIPLSRTEEPPVLLAKSAKPAVVPRELSTSSSNSVLWEEQFSKDIKGWYDYDDHYSYNATIEGVGGGKAKITECGDSGWGKSAIVIEDLNIAGDTEIVVKVDSVDHDSAFKIGISSLDWGEYYDLIGGKNFPGIYKVKIAEATGWEGNKDFNLVLVIEGTRKSATFDYIKISE